MNEQKEQKENRGEQEKRPFSPRPLLQLIPAVVVAAAVAVTLPMTNPVLQQVPQRLTAEAAVLEETQAADEAEEETGDPELLPYADGTYEGEAQGYGGIIRVRVTMSGGRITDIEILEASGETESFFNRAKKLIDTVLEKQTWEVDVVSGATYSSKGILGAIQNALTGEAVENEAAETTMANASALQAESFSEPSSYRDGTYTGSATGFGGTITVSVTISGGKISDVTVVSAPGETASYLSQAMSVVSAIVSSGSPNVDTVSGATYSSTGIINAVKRALSQAAVSGSSDLTINETPASDNSTPAPTPIPADPNAKPSETYLDGTYTGSGEGFGGEVSVRVTVSGGRIASIDVLSAEDETPTYFERAKVMLMNMVSAQSSDVDAISGATYSSEGLREAVKAALAQAKAGAVKPTPTPTPTPTVTPAPTPTATPTPTPTVTPDPGTDTSRYEDGTYTATALCTDRDEEGMTFEYQIAVTVTVENDVITKVTAEKQDDVSEEPDQNDKYLDYAKNGRTRKNVTYTGVIEQILTKQNTEVDVVSTATYSSNAIAEAAKEALKKAEKKTETVTPTPTPTPTPEPGTDTKTGTYQDGTYSTTVQCTDRDEEGMTFDYQLTVTIRIEEDKITAVTAEKQEDVSEEPDQNDKYLDYAKNGRTRKNVTYTGVIEQILTKQNTEVDAVSGATYSSDAIKTAVQLLLEEASAENSTEEGGTQS